MKMEKLSEEQMLQNRDALATHYQEILGLLGEDVNREGLIKTPMRVAKAMQYLTKGYREDPAAVLRSAMFEEEDYKQMVIVKDIDFFSLCEHHMLPFFGNTFSPGFIYVILFVVPSNLPFSSILTSAII